jgi:hypothetical protein
VVKRLLAVMLVSAIMPTRAFAIEASDRYRSPRNPERRIRSSTELIVLHTTEAAERGSLIKLSDRGEAHYCVTESGSVYRIVDRDREAFHAGRSMWCGKEDVDRFSIGIECVGNHDKAMPPEQIAAIRTLVKELQSMYRLSDDKVVCHSHVAYGAPNRWHKQKHRGRKRCGMLFAMPSVRAQLGLKTRPAYDADVRAKRLVVGDDYLKKVLYGNVDTMRSAYASKQPPKEDTGLFSWFRRKEAPAAKPAPKAAPKAQAAAPKPQAAAPKAQVAAPSPPASVKELVSRGYAIKGTVSKNTTASKIAGGKWNSPDTYYTIRNKVIPGNKIDPAHIENGMCIWMHK